MKTKLFPLLILCVAVTSLQAQIDRSKMPKSGPAPEINLGSPETFKLDNGLKVLLVENHELPRVRARLTLDNKPQPQGDKVGLKSLYSAMMGNGTAEMNKDSFNERIDFLGANVGYGSAGASASSLKRFFPEVFGLMSKGLLAPRYEEDEFKSQKKRLIEGIESNKNNTKTIAQHLQGALTYGEDHPYGEFPRVKTVEKIDLNDVKSYYHSNISPENAYLVIVGDIDMAQVKDLAHQYFEDWQGETPPALELSKPEQVPSTEIDFVNVSNAVQSEIAVMNPVYLQKTNTDYFAALIANQILGGGSDGRLFNNLREDKGYTYGAYSSLSSDQYVSDFKAAASVRNPVTDSSVVAFLDEIHRIRNKKVGKKELQHAKAKYTGSFVRALEDPSTIARYALAIEKENLPDDFYQNYLKNIAAVSRKEVKKAANKYFKANNERIIIAGKGSEVQKGLEALTYKGKNIPVKYFDKKGTPIEKKEYNKEVSADVTVSTIYDHYLKAIGGKKAAAQIKTLYIKLNGSMGSRSITMITKETEEGKSLMKLSSGGMTLQKTVFDGEEGYTEAQGKKNEFSKEQNAVAKKQAGLIPELKVADSAAVTGIEEVEGEEAYVVENGDESSYYALDSGLKLQTVEETKMGTSTTIFKDYEPENGVKFPQRISQSFGPQSIEFTVDEIKINQNVSAEDFE